MSAEKPVTLEDQIDFQQRTVDFYNDAYFQCKTYEERAKVLDRLKFSRAILATLKSLQDDGK